VSPPLSHAKKEKKKRFPCSGLRRGESTKEALLRGGKKKKWSPSSIFRKRRGRGGESQVTYLTERGGRGEEDKFCNRDDLKTHGKGRKGHPYTY